MKKSKPIPRAQWVVVVVMTPDSAPLGSAGFVADSIISKNSVTCQHQGSKEESRRPCEAAAAGLVRGGWSLHTNALSASCVPAEGLLVVRAGDIHHLVVDQVSRFAGDCGGLQ